MSKMAGIPATGISGRPVAISPRTAYVKPDEPDGCLLGSLICGGGDGNFMLCDGVPDEVDFDSNPTGVFVAVHTKQWNLAVERLKFYPKEASQWVVRYGKPIHDNLTPIGKSASDRFDFQEEAGAALTSPKQGQQFNQQQKTLRWRMLPLHAAILFGAPFDVVKTLIQHYPAACSAHDDQGMLPLHLAFRAGSSEEIVVHLLEKYPQAIEREDYKGRLPSMLGPKNSTNYSDSIAEAYVKGPAYYYWAARVSTADRVRSETAMTKQIKQLEEFARASDKEGKARLDKTERQLANEIEALTVENNELKERVTWYESKYDGAEERERVLVDHTNSLAERLRLTSLSEEHLATKLAKIESKSQNKEAELKEARSTAAKEKEALESTVKELKQLLSKMDGKVESLTEKLEKKAKESDELKVQFDKERNLFEKQIDASKQCMMELIASSKEDKRTFEQEAKELRQQLVSTQVEAQKASKQHFEEESEELRRQLDSIKKEMKRAAEANSTVQTQDIETKLDNLRSEMTNNTRSYVVRNVADSMRSPHHKSSMRDMEDRMDRVQRDVTRAQRTYTASRDAPQSPGGEISQSESYISMESSSTAELNVRQSKRTPMETPDMIEEEEEHPFDTYVSIKASTAEDTRDDPDCFSHQSDVDTAVALGELTDDQRLALERLDLSGTKEDIARMLSGVPGLTKNQVNLLVDVASTLAM